MDPTSDSPTPERGDPLRASNDDHGRRSVRGGAVMVLSHALQLALGIGSTMVVARILTPDDFGLFAMAAVALALARSVGDFGVPMAVVHEARPDPDALDQLFRLSVRWNALLALVLGALAPAVAAFFGEPVLLWITFLLAAGVFLEGATSVQLGLLRRRLSFATVAWMEIGAQAAGVSVAVTTALLGGGYWALVLQQVTAASVQAVVRWFTCGWWPRWTRAGGGESLASLRRFGRYATYSRVLVAIGREVDRVLIGRLAGAGALGLYHNAQRWSFFPVQQLHLPLLGVAVASFSRLQEEPERYARYVRAALLGFFAAVLPSIAFLLLMAHDAVPVLLGPQWDEAIPLFRILAVGAVFLGVVRPLKWIYLSEGRTRQQFLWQLIATPITVGALAAGTPWGARGVAIGYTLGAFALCVPAVLFCLRRSPLPRDVVWLAAWRPALASAVGVGVIAGLSAIVDAPGSPVLRLVLAALLFGATYVAGWLALPGGRRSGKELLEVVRQLRS